MKLITAPTIYYPEDNEIKCFLAGGITDCANWQKEVYEDLQSFGEMEKLILFNPRQDNFDVTNPTAAEDQITWEFDYLSQMDIFSMYFAKSSSVQPICMYELGRHLAEMKRRFPEDYLDRIVISIEDGYLRAQDVAIQTKLALGVQGDIIIYHGSPWAHAKEISILYSALI